MSTYLVTGAAGFIAARVCEMLLAEGHSVVGVDNLNDYYDVRLKYYRLARLAELGGCTADEVARIKEQVIRGETSKSKPETGNLKPEGSESDSGLKFQVSGLSSQVSLKSDRFEFHTLDIEDLPALERVFAGSNFSAVFNLAARAGVRYSIENPHVYLSTNTLGTLNILECMRKHGVKKQVLASTSSLYAGCPMPFTEDQPVNTPLSPYAATKKAAEMLSWTWHKIHGIDTTVVRYFTVYGPAGRPDMAPFRFVHWVATGQPIKLFGDGTASRDFTYVDDIARGTILAAGPLGGRRTEEGRSDSQSRIPEPRTQFQTSAFEIINLGGGNRPITISAMIGLIENYLGKKAVIDYLPVNPVDMTDTQADITKAGKLLGWKPEISPEEGFRRTVEWYLANREWLMDVKV
jgi:UDP-glucuronate 4-epimerase